MSKTIVFIPLKISFVLTNSADPEEMPHDAAYHPSLRCLPKYPFRGFRSTNGIHVNYQIHVIKQEKKTVFLEIHV